MLFELSIGIYTDRIAIHMNKEDYAIIIGLKDYPGFDNLPKNGKLPLIGPENDAKAFKDWVISTKGGAVPNDKDHIELILSSQFNPPFKSTEHAKPVASQVQSAFRRLYKLYKANLDAKKGPRIGRRLYVFMAGHGIAPTITVGESSKEAALLMADADPDFLGSNYHILGAYTAQWFCKNDCFDEVFLFMDCCREDYLVAALNRFLPMKGNSDKAIRCFFFGTKWSRRSREKAMSDEKNLIRGVFSKTLLLGLWGAAAIQDPAHPDQVQITVSSLKSFLYQNMKFFIDPKYENEKDLQEPDVDFSPNEKDGRDIVINTIPQLGLFPVTIRPPVNETGKVIVIFYYDDKVEVKKEHTAIPPEWQIRLPRGKYIAQLESNGKVTKTIFDVRGIEDLSGIGAVEVNLQAYA